MEINLAEKRQGAANNPRQEPGGCPTPKGWGRKTHLLTVCGQPAASSRLRHAYMQSAAVHLKNGQVARADRRAPLSYGQPKNIEILHACLKVGPSTLGSLGTLRHSSCTFPPPVLPSVVHSSCVYPPPKVHSSSVYPPPKVHSSCVYPPPVLSSFSSS